MTVIIDTLEQRFLGRISYPMAGGTHSRTAPAYPVWMAQRLLDVFAAMTEGDRQRVCDWLAETGGHHTRGAPAWQRIPRK